jgi:hypothetical protein
VPVVLVFDSSALIFARPILAEILGRATVVIPQQVASEIGQVPKGVSIKDLEESEQKYVAKLLRRYRGKDEATDYTRGRRLQGIGELEAMVLARKLGVKVVLHDQKALEMARQERLEAVPLADLPAKIGLPRSSSLDEFYRKLKSMRDPRALAKG